MFKDLVFFVINNVVSHIPSRRIRMVVYSKLSKGKISRNSYIGLGVRILDIRKITIGDGSNVNFGSILDGRGAELVIGKNVDIAPQTNIWTLEHDPNSETHDSRAGSVIIHDNAWIGNRVIILPGSIIQKSSVVGAGSVVVGTIEADSLYIGVKAKKAKQLLPKESYSIGALRRFR